MRNFCFVLVGCCKIVWYYDMLKLQICKVEFKGGKEDCLKIELGIYCEGQGWVDYLGKGNGYVQLGI